MTSKPQPIVSREAAYELFDRLVREKGLGKDANGDGVIDRFEKKRDFSEVDFKKIAGLDILPLNNPLFANADPATIHPIELLLSAGYTFSEEARKEMESLVKNPPALPELNDLEVSFDDYLKVPGIFNLLPKLAAIQKIIGQNHWEEFFYPRLTRLQEKAAVFVVGYLDHADPKDIYFRRFETLFLSSGSFSAAGSLSELLGPWYNPLSQQMQALREIRFQKAWEEIKSQYQNRPWWNAFSSYIEYAMQAVGNNDAEKKGEKLEIPDEKAAGEILGVCEKIIIRTNKAPVTRAALDMMVEIASAGLASEHSNLEEIFFLLENNGDYLSRELAAKYLAQYAKFDGESLLAYVDRIVSLLAHPMRKEHLFLAEALGWTARRVARKQSEIIGKMADVALQDVTDRLPENFETLNNFTPVLCLQHIIRLDTALEEIFLPGLKAQLEARATKNPSEVAAFLQLWQAGLVWAEFKGEIGSGEWDAGDFIVALSYAMSGEKTSHYEAIKPALELEFGENDFEGEPKLLGVVDRWQLPLGAWDFDSIRKPATQKEKEWVQGLYAGLLDRIKTEEGWDTRWPLWNRKAKPDFVLSQLATVASPENAQLPKLLETWAKRWVDTSQRAGTIQKVVESLLAKGVDVTPIMEFVFSGYLHDALSDLFGTWAIWAPEATMAFLKRHIGDTQSFGPVRMARWAAMLEPHLEKVPEVMAATRADLLFHLSGEQTELEALARRNFEFNLNNPATRDAYRNFLTESLGRRYTEALLSLFKLFLDIGSEDQPNVAYDVLEQVLANADRDVVTNALAVINDNISTFADRPKKVSKLLPGIMVHLGDRSYATWPETVLEKLLPAIRRYPPNAATAVAKLMTTNLYWKKAERFGEMLETALIDNPEELPPVFSILDATLRDPGREDSFYNTLIAASYVADRSPADFALAFLRAFEWIGKNPSTEGTPMMIDAIDRFFRAGVPVPDVWSDLGVEMLWTNFDKRNVVIAPPAFKRLVQVISKNGYASWLVAALQRHAKKNGFTISDKTTHTMGEPLINAGLYPYDDLVKLSEKYDWAGSNAKRWEKTVKEVLGPDGHFIRGYSYADLSNIWDSSAGYRYEKEFGTAWGHQLYRVWIDDRPKEEIPNKIFNESEAIRRTAIPEILELAEKYLDKDLKRWGWAWVWDNRQELFRWQQDGAKSEEEWRFEYGLNFFKWLSRYRQEDPKRFTQVFLNWVRKQKLEKDSSEKVIAVLEAVESNRPLRATSIRAEMAEYKAATRQNTVAFTLEEAPILKVGDVPKKFDALYGRLPRGTWKVEAAGPGDADVLELAQTLEKEGSEDAYLYDSGYRRHLKWNFSDRAVTVTLHNRRDDPDLLKISVTFADGNKLVVRDNGLSGNIEGELITAEDGSVKIGPHEKGYAPFQAWYKNLVAELDRLKNLGKGPQNWLEGRPLQMASTGLLQKYLKEGKPFMLAVYQEGSEDGKKLTDALIQFSQQPSAFKVPVLVAVTNRRDVPENMMFEKSLFEETVKQIVGNKGDKTPITYLVNPKGSVVEILGEVEGAETTEWPYLLRKNAAALRKNGASLPLDPAGESPAKPLAALLEKAPIEAPDLIQKPTEAPRTFALIVNGDTSESANSVWFAPQVRQIYASLLKQQIPSDRIILAGEGMEEDVKLLKRLPGTKNGLEEAIRYFRDNLRPQDQLVLYSLAHGDEEKRENERHSQFWLNGDKVTSFDFKRLLDSLPNRHTFTFTSSCFSREMLLYSQEEHRDMVGVAPFSDVAHGMSFEPRFFGEQGDFDADGNGCVSLEERFTASNPLSEFYLQGELTGEMSLGGACEYLKLKKKEKKK